ncbi:MAG TPA: DUF4032 domain-containing protein [Egibacteraceae bacterium]|nr:DUF4032 domain-containing protein [Egibacteraceae bacterium]
MDATTRGLRILTRPGHPDFLDLPWSRPMEEWSGERIVEVARGVHRHVVRFIDYEGSLYALKELPPRLADREYRLLRKMAEDSLPVVDVAGVVHRAGMPGGNLEDVLVTRFLDYSLPYRTVFKHRRRDDPVGEVRDLSDRLLDALAMLLVRLHVAGYFWGDCSLSNTLFRRDAGALAAYLVDMETGEWHPQLSDGQREHDLEVTEENVAGGLLDLQAELGLPGDLDAFDVAHDLGRRYTRLWNEVTTNEVIGPDERYRIQARMRRLNELGFDVDEVELVAAEDGDRLVMKISVTEQGHHRRRLMALTGLEAQENQARSLLNDLANFRASGERRAGRPLPETLAAHRWLAEVFEPTVGAIPDGLRGKLEPAEVFHEVIEHKWFLSECAGRDVGVQEAVASYMRTVLPAVPDERTVLALDDDGFMGYG